ncbi:MAG: DNA polymerase III subunit delta [Nitratireductor sp.]
MSTKKAHEVEQYLKRPDKNFRVILLYGPDSGLVNERADFLAKQTGVDLKDPFSTIRLNSDDVAQDKSRLVDEAFTVGMFGGERVIRVSGTTQRNLGDAVKPVLGQTLTDCWIIIEAGDLKKTAGLRTAVEKSKTAMALPCYQDDARALEQLIREEITDKQISISAEAVSLLKPMLGGDRMASRNELQKLALYCQDKGKVEQEDIREILSDASLLDTSDLIDAVATGNLKNFEETLGRILNSGVSPDMLLIFTLRHFQILHEMRSKMTRDRTPASDLIKYARPPIHYSRRTLISSALAKWNENGLVLAMKRLDNASFEARANPLLSQSIAGTNLLALTVQASKR